MTEQRDPLSSIKKVTKRQKTPKRFRPPVLSRLEKQNPIGTPRASKRWQFEKPEKRPCVTYTVPIEQLDQLRDRFDKELIGDDRSAIRHWKEVAPGKRHNVAVWVEPQEPKVQAPTFSFQSTLFSCTWASKTRYEIECSRRLAIVLNGSTEVTTEVGRIDVLTNSELIELKVAHNWKHGIGQLLAYGFYHQQRELHLILVGSNADEYVDIARFHCDRFNIKVSTFNL